MVGETLRGGIDAPTTEAILGRSFETLPIFGEAPVLSVTEGQFALGQNTPNPFINATEIQFTLNRAQTVRLAMYDLQGRTVSVLREGRFEAGTYVVPVSGSGLSAGHYLYSLQTDDGRAVKRLVKQ